MGRLTRRADDVTKEAKEKLIKELDKGTELWFCLGLGVWGSGDTGSDWSA